MTRKKTILWVLCTTLIYFCLAAGFWLASGCTKSARFCLIASLPVFLFAALFYMLVKRMRRDFYENK